VKLTLVTDDGAKADALSFKHNNKIIDRMSFVEMANIVQQLNYAIDTEIMNTTSVNFSLCALITG